MIMNFARLKNRTRKTGFFIPVTIYFFVFAIFILAAWNWLTKKPIQTGSAYADIFQILLTVAGWFTIILIVISLLTVMVSFLFFVLQKRKNNISFKIQTDLAKSELNQKQIVRLYINPILKPLLGFIKIRLIYDDVYFSQKFSLIENRKLSLFNKTIEGNYNWPLPQIKEYRVQFAIIYFEDVFQFFSLAVKLPASNRFFTHPTATDIKEMKSMPRKTEETSTRIDEMRKVEGEYLNYKNFENNDDVRRIVWKIYAKNKELVVRMPEVMDPYASHMYLYVSFFSQFAVESNNIAQVPFLNYFKIITWSVYESLVKKGFDVRYIADQDVLPASIPDEKQSVRYMVSVSNWHTDKDLASFVKTKDASVIIISSFSDADQVQQMVEQFGNEITFVFVKLTDSLQKHNMLHLMQWLFIQKEKNDMDVYKTNWRFSTLRPAIIKNEKRIEAILEKYQDLIPN